MTKGKGSSVRKKEFKERMKTNMWKSWNVGKWSPLRVRVLESM
jgi:hypothetical protein